jgi:capsid portal protein
MIHQQGKKPAVSSISESLRALDSSDDEDSLFLERQPKQKPSDDQRLSFRLPPHYNYCGADELRNDDTEVIED